MLPLEEIMKKLGTIEKRLKKLENHVYHPPHIQKLLEYIQKAEAVTIEDLRSTFPKFHGGSLTRLYRIVERDSRFRLVRGKARWSPTVIAYFGENNEPTTPTAMAVDFFQRIPPLTYERRVTERGGSYKIPRGKQISIQAIMKTYKIDFGTAKQVLDKIESLFGKRLLPAKMGKRRFLRRY